MKYYLLSLILIFSVSIHSQSRFDKVEIKTTPLTDKVYMLEGAGGNIGVVAGLDGILLIDDQYGPLSDKIKAAVVGMSNAPIQYVANTHWHGDHTGGNEAFGNAGATIVAHKNVRKRMSEEQSREGRVTPAAPAIALPVITFGEDLQLHFNGLELMAIHVDNAHTDGDAFIWIPEANVLHMGDVFFHKRYPFIDLSSGGSVNGLIKAVETALFLVDDDTQIIPGHGPMADRADLKKYHDFLKTVRLRIKSYSDVGRSLEQIDPAKVVEGYEEWTWGFINDETLVKLFYSSLTGE